MDFIVGGRGGTAEQTSFFMAVVFFQVCYFFSVFYRKAVSYTHLDVYKRQAIASFADGGSYASAFCFVVFYGCAFVFGGEDVDVVSCCEMDVLGVCLLYTSLFRSSAVT